MVVVRSERFSSFLLRFFLFNSSNNRKVLYFLVCVLFYIQQRVSYSHMPIFLLVGGGRLHFFLFKPSPHVFIEGGDGIVYDPKKNPFLT